MATSVKTDYLNNVCAAGYFEGTIDFDPGIGVLNLTSSGSRDVFIMKLASDGSFLWAKQIGLTV
jgi:hypothetical protein